MYALIFWCKNVTLFLHVHSWYSRSTWRINAHLGWCRHHQYQRSYLLVFFLRVDYPATRRNDFGPDGGYRRQVKLGETMCHHVGKSWCEVMYCDLMNMWWLWRLWGWSGVLCCAVVWCACIRGPGATEAVSGDVAANRSCWLRGYSIGGQPWWAREKKKDRKR